MNNFMYFYVYCSVYVYTYICMCSLPFTKSWEKKKSQAQNTIEGPFKI